ncbi:type II toxin-antitoxin system VapB family antitoxin [Streptomyces sp. NPDC058662]|uniref:type II toxin-antitoxin system VapB family antitoxin n=1 Tax=Streptomyces sp. NPDC058662 TaxID=3346583 RepID=UPI003664E4E3
MARTVIDVDDALLAEAAEIFGTKTKVATVNAALQDVVNRRKREEFLSWIAAGGLPDLTGPVDSAVESDAGSGSGSGSGTGVEAAATEHTQDRAA